MYTLIYITTSGFSESKKIAMKLLQEKLVVCTNIIREIDSFYLWKGEINEDKESLLIAKTHSGKVGILIKRVEEIHSYETPCILQIQVKKGSKNYLNWMESELD
jgi:periplasmic divalent cation tolerance protein